jgi:putative ATP-binding cassette transporter
MDTSKIPHKITVTRFVRAVKNFAVSEDGWKAKWMFAGLIALLCGINGMNVVNSYVGRDFMTAIASRNKAAFVQQALFYIGVFAASTLVSVVARFTEERLGLLWRQFVTRRAVAAYLIDGTYYRLHAAGTLENPDQRIAEDVRAFTVTTLSFVLMVLNSSFTIVAFSGVLWSISPVLFIVAVLYAAGGSSLTIALGRPLVRLNYDQLDREANFRSSLMHVRENAEVLMLAHREGQLAARLLQRLDDVVANFRRIIGINRRVGFFTTGYNWMIQIIPALFIAPAFIDGKVDFGVITQSAMAFSLLVSAFSLIVTQFQSISTFAAVVARLSSLMEAVEQSQTSTGSAIEIVPEEGRVAYEQLTLLSSENGHPVLKALSISIPFGTRVLLSGANQAARVVLFRATVGLVTAGTGRIMRPGADDIRFLAERPYLPPGTLRQVLVRTLPVRDIADDQIVGLLRELHLESVLARAGGLDKEQDWDTLLSLREQQLLAFLHILLAAPRFAFLDRASTALYPDQVHKILHMLSEKSISYINNGKSDDPLDLYDAVLDIEEDGSWTWKPVRSMPLESAAGSQANQSGVGT